MEYSKNLKILYSFIKPYRAYFILCIVLTILLAVLGPIRPFLIQKTIDEYTQNGLKDMILNITLIQIGILILESLVRYGFMYGINFLGQSVILDMRDLIFRRISTRNISFFHKNPVGTLSTRVINDLESVNKIFSDGIISILGDVLLMLTTLGLMFYTNVNLSLISLVTLPIIWIATIWFKNTVKVNFEKVRNAIAKLNTFVQERLSGLYIIQAFGKENETMDDFSVYNQEFTSANIRTIFAYAVYFPIVELLSAISIVILVSYGFMGGGDNFSTGQLVAFIMYINMLFRPLRMIADKFNVLQMGMIALNRVTPLLEKDQYNEDGVLEDVETDEKLSGDIVYENVGFSYEEDGPRILEGLDLKLSNGESMAIIGATGAGKTTIINLLNRLYDNYQGNIRINGEDIKNVGLARLRQSVGMITQDVMMVSGTLRDNIVMQHKDITDQDLDEVAENLGVSEYIDKLENRWDYHVGSRGSSLSTGQKQLVAFLRVMLMDPQILVLDEATASIDMETEEIIQTALDKASENRSMIVIAHRLHTIQNCDSIYMLRDKKLEKVESYEAIIDNLEELGIYSESTPNAR